eukprot:1866736-Rhodomonas_salina.2
MAGSRGDSSLGSPGNLPQRRSRRVCLPVSLFLSLSPSLSGHQPPDPSLPCTTPLSTSPSLPRTTMSLSSSLSSVHRFAVSAGFLLGAGDPEARTATSGSSSQAPGGSSSLGTSGLDAAQGWSGLFGVLTVFVFVCGKM